VFIYFLSFISKYGLNMVL